MKRHLDEGPSPGLVPNKEGLYSRANPVSPPGHILGPAIPTGAPPIMSTVQNVQSILHLSSQPTNAPPSSSPQLYPKDSNLTSVQYQYGSGKPSVQPPLHMRHKVHTSSNMTVPGPGTPPGSSSQQHFQRLKVEDALSYLDQVKFKFGNQPQVYNDFLDIMKEFKSQSIDTPGVIQRVSNLFKGHPELIVGFNTFLPPGYKIEVQSNEQGVALQVSVSMPSPTAATTTLIQTSHHPMGPQSETITVVPSGVKHSSSGPPMVPRSTSPQPAASSHFQHTVPATGGNLLSQTAFGMLPISQQPAHLAVSQALSNVDSPHPTPQSQPVEFNHAINYVNKIKNRFQGQPDKYKKFLEILHTYQKEQRNAKEGTCGGTKHLTEAEVYSQVSKLFEHQEDLLAEFGQFLPDATSHLNAKHLQSVEHPSTVKKSSSTLKTLTITRDSSGSERDTPRSSGPKPAPTSLKRSSSFSSGTPKKHKMTSLRDVTIAEAAKYANLTDYAFFDKVRRALKNQDIYENFLRCLMLYNQEILSKIELVQLVQQFLVRFPDLFRWFKDFLGVPDQTGLGRVDLIPSGVRQDRPTGDLAMEIDYSTCKRLGASYCALPKSYILPKSSGRTALCREVLNDTWVSFPTWSEDSTFVTSRKTIFEEYIYRCEDERFELDVVIETNGATIRVLEAVQKKISRMTPEEAQKFRLDDCLGGTSPTIHLRAIARVYGDKAPDMIDGLKKSPLVAIPVVLRRLRAKEDEWREAQKGFNKIWREQNEKYYLKSLDHQGMNFKQTDVKYLGSKALYNEIETIFEERHESNEEGAPETGPHLILYYKDKTILDDAANLLIHHAKRLSGLQKEDKQKIKVILRHFLPDLFQHQRQELSDDEKDDFDDMDGDENVERAKPSNGIKIEPELVKKEIDEDAGPNDESYSLFMANSHWYFFLRLHQILCDRLGKMYEKAEKLAIEETKDKQSRKESTSVALRLKPKVDVEVCDYYPTLLDMVKGLLDGNMESTTFEDNLREMFGIHAYMAFTLDKVVTYAVRQLQHIVCDDVPQGCMALHVEEAKRGGAGGLLRTAHQRSAPEAAYQKKLEQLLSDESCYKVYIYQKDCKMTIELLDTETDEPEPSGESLKWAQYRDNYVDSMRNFPTDEDVQSMEKPVYLSRNIRAWKKLHSRTSESSDNKEEGMDVQMEESRDERKEEKPPPTRMGEQPPSDTIAQDSSECRFNLNSYKILFVINKDNLLYKNNALSNAKNTHPKVTKIKDKKFRKWVGQWVEENCTESEVKQCSEWLMGRGPDVVSNRTVVLNDNDLNKPPYMPYNRYSVEVLE